MITWPIFLALFLAILAIYLKVKSENKTRKKEGEITKKSEDPEDVGKENE